MTPSPIPSAPSIPGFPMPTAAGMGPTGIPGQPAQQQQQPAQPKFVYTLRDQAGQTGTVDEHFVAQQLTQAGYGVKGISPDGATLKMADAQGDYEVPVRSMLAGLGWNVTSARPTQADYENVQPGWRATLENLGDDVEKHAYLMKNLGDLGMADAKIEGGGDDWFVHNPQTGDWVALTNKPGFDTSDILPGIQTGLHALGAGAAGLAAAETGPGAVLAGVAGGAGVEAAARGLNAAIDPNFRAVAGMGNQLRDVGFSAAGDLMGGAAGGLLGAGLRKVAGPAISRALMRPLSSAAQGVGKVAAPVGRGIGQLGAAADTQLGRYMASGMIPGAGGAVNAGFLAQTPAMALRLPAEGIAKAASSKIGEKILGPALSRSIGWGARHVGQAPTTSEMFGRAANVLTTPFRGKPPVGSASRAAYARDFGVAKAMGYDGPTARAYARARMTSRASRPGGSDAFDIGQKVGIIPEGLEALGRPLERFGLGVTGIATKGLKYGGRALQAAGEAADRFGAAARPFEPWAARHPLTEEYIADPLRGATERSWAEPQPRRTMLAEEAF